MNISEGNVFCLRWDASQRSKIVTSEKLLHRVIHSKILPVILHMLSLDITTNFFSVNTVHMMSTFRVTVDHKLERMWKWAWPILSYPTNICRRG